MNTNHYLEIGTDHKVCQDFCASGFTYNVERGPTYYAVVCDGCSSAPHSEFGAQVITHAAINELQRNPYVVPEDFIRELMYRAKESVKQVGVDPRCLLATLLLVRADTDTTVVSMWGDGVYNITLKNGAQYTDEVHYEGNAPYYPYYMVTSDEHSRYLSEFNCTKHVKFGSQHGGEGKATYTGNEALQVTTRRIETEQVKSVTLMSDGVGSFQDINKQYIPTADIIKEVTAFKTTTGQYIERRMTAFKQRMCAANGWSHWDDLAVSGISL